MSFNIESTRMNLGRQVIFNFYNVAACDVLLRKIIGHEQISQLLTVKISVSLQEVWGSNSGSDESDTVVLSTCPILEG